MPSEEHVRIFSCITVKDKALTLRDVKIARYRLFFLNCLFFCEYDTILIIGICITKLNGLPSISALLAENVYLNFTACLMLCGFLYFMTSFSLLYTFSTFHVIKMNDPTPVKKFFQRYDHIFRFIARLCLFLFFILATSLIMITVVLLTVLPVLHYTIAGIAVFTAILRQIILCWRRGKVIDLYYYRYIWNEHVSSLLSGKTRGGGGGGDPKPTWDDLYKYLSRDDDDDDDVDNVLKKADDNMIKTFGYSYHTLGWILILNKLAILGAIVMAVVFGSYIYFMYKPEMFYPISLSEYYLFKMIISFQLFGILDIYLPLQDIKSN